MSCVIWQEQGRRKPQGTAKTQVPFGREGIRGENEVCNLSRHMLGTASAITFEVCRIKMASLRQRKKREQWMWMLKGGLALFYFNTK